jgi:hypothetical protein
MAFRRESIAHEHGGSGDMRFWILLAAVIGYHIEDVWVFLLISKHYHPGYPGRIIEAVFSPGWLLFRSYFAMDLANAFIYGVISCLVFLAIAKLRRT